MSAPDTARPTRRRGNGGTMSWWMILLLLIAVWLVYAAILRSWKDE